MKRAFAIAAILACGGSAVAPHRPPPRASAAAPAASSAAPAVAAPDDAGAPVDASDTSAAMRTMRIASMTWSESDPEGGHSVITVHASGYVEAYGHKSCCGYTPRMATGFYRVTKTAALQALFDDAAASLATHEGEPAKTQDPGFGMHDQTTATVDGVEKPLALFFQTDELGLVAIASRPADLATPKVEGHVPASKRVLRVLFLRAIEEVPRLSRAQVQLVLGQLRARAAHDRDQGFLDFVAEVLAKVDGSALDLVAPLLGEPQFVAADAAIAALGAHGSAARPYARLVHDAARKTDATLIAAAVALARIGGDEADKWVDGELVPALSGAPKERNLDLYYRVRYAEALAAIGRPSSTQALQSRVVPDLRARLDAAMKRTPPAVSDVADIHRVLAARLPATFLSRDVPQMLERALAQKDVGARQIALQAMQSFYKPGECPAELARVLGAVTDASIRPNADEVRKRLCPTH